MTLRSKVRGKALLLVSSVALLLVTGYMPFAMADLNETNNLIALDSEDEGGRLPPPGGPPPPQEEGDFQGPGQPPVSDIRVQRRNRWAGDEGGPQGRRFRQFRAGGQGGPEEGSFFPRPQFRPGQGGEEDFPGRQFPGGPDEGPGGLRAGEFRGGQAGFNGMRPGGFRGQGGNFRGMQGGGGMHRPKLDLTPLGLTEDQKAKIEAMHEQTRNRVKELRKGMMQKQVQVRNLMFSPDATDVQIRAARKELRNLQDQVDESNFNDLLGIRAILTAEQKKRLPECMPGPNQTGSRFGGQPGDDRRPGGWQPQNAAGMGLQNGSRISDADDPNRANRREMRQLRQRFSSRTADESNRN